jgi:hypothetical protein
MKFWSRKGDNWSRMDEIPKYRWRINYGTIKLEGQFSQRDCIIKNHHLSSLFPIQEEAS